MEFAGGGGRRRHDDLKQLTAAYALDAVDPLETRAIEKHLLGCRQCRREVAELREVAAQLCLAGGPAPARVWDRIAAEVADRRRVLTLIPRPAQSTIPARSARAQHRAVSVELFVAVVAVAAVVIAALGLQIRRVDRQTDRVAIGLSAPGNQAAWQLAVASADARQVTLKSPDGSRSASAVVLADGTSMLGPNNLPPLSDQRSYQLWGQVGPAMVSLAVLRTASAYQQFSTPAQTVALVITNEPASGVIATTKPAVVSARMPSP
jgi:hypothetical protein